MKVKMMISGLLVGVAVKAAFATTVTLAPPSGTCPFLRALALEGEN